MNDEGQSDKEFLDSVISYVDGLLIICNDDLHKLNLIAVDLRAAKKSGRITDMDYTVDQERLQRTINKCKTIILTLLTQRKRATKFLKELPT